MRVRGRSWAWIVVLLLLAGSFATPVLADTPPSTEPEQTAVNGPGLVNVDIEGSLGSRTLFKPRLTETPPRPIVVKLEGTIIARSVTNLGEWQIDENIVNVTIRTVIEPSDYDPQVGDHVVVRALRTQSSLEALEITVGMPYQPVEFRGIIVRCVEVSPYLGEWLVGNTTVIVTDQTRGIENPKPGLYAQVRGTLQQGKTVVASEITMLDPNAAASGFQFKGLVQSMPSGKGFWIIGGIPGEVNSRTVIVGQDKIKLGSLVEVEGQRAGLRVVFCSIALVEEQAQIVWEGVIQQAAPESVGEWVIGEKSVVVDESTFVDESHGRAQPGMWAQVTATQIDGLYRAVRLRVEQP